MGNFLANVFSNIKAWLQAVGVGAVVALQQYVAVIDAADPDPISALIRGAIVAGLVKLLGALVRSASPA